jgi:hypothetical protein
MKYLLSGLLIALFITVPAIAEEKKANNKRQGSEGKYQKNTERRKPAEQWRILDEISEDERARLRKLYDSDQKAFRKELAKIVSQIRQKEKERDQLVKSLVQKYKTAKDPDEKKKVYEELRKLTRKIFMQKMENNRKRLESLEKHVKTLRRQYEFRKHNADKIIQSRLDALTSDMAFEW